MENIEHTKETKATQEPIGRQAKSVENQKKNKNTLVRGRTVRLDKRTDRQTATYQQSTTQCFFATRAPTRMHAPRCFVLRAY